MRPLTPDFYVYDWCPVAAARVEGRFAELSWSDGASLRAFDFWLRENAVDGTDADGQPVGGIEPVSRESVLDPAHLDDGIRIASVAITDDGALAVTWADDGRTSVFHPGWLRHVADGRHLPDGWFPEPVTWTSAELSEPPTHDGTDILDSPDTLRAWGNDLLRYGIARLRGVPVDHDFNAALAAHIGPIRETNFGVLWDVKAVIDPNSTANTNLRLGPHSDLPTRETPPGFQFLHCVENEATGGWSTMADGAAVAAHIEQAYPEAYEALTTLRWVFFNRGDGIDHRWSGPIIDHGVPGTPLTFRAFYPVRGFPDMDDADLPRAYEALRIFSTVAADDRFQMRYPFTPGDLVAFDNRRILHGRDAYESGGRRHLRGMYMDHDEIRSFVRVANRRAAAV